MRSARDELGARRFQPEVLTGQQIAGFFSRMATKKKLAPSRVNRGESDDEVLGEDNRAADRGGGGPFGNLCICDEGGFPSAPNCILVRLQHL